jgi:hypothetical protein
MEPTSMLLSSPPIFETNITSIIRILKGSRSKSSPAMFHPKARRIFTILTRSKSLKIISTSGAATISSKIKKARRDQQTTSIPNTRYSLINKRYRRNTKGISASTLITSLCPTAFTKKKAPNPCYSNVDIETPSTLSKTTAS